MRRGSLIIRPACEKDNQTILALARVFVTSFELDEEAFKSSFSKLVCEPAAHFAVAELDSRVVGYLLGFEHLALYANGPVGLVEEITVEEGFRLQGIGEELMSSFETWARDRGVRLVSLATRRAAAFYLAIGYEESATYFRKKLVQE